MDKIKIKMIFIKIAYIVGIILDGLLGIDMFLYTFLGKSIYLHNQNIPISSNETQPVMMFGTALMIGWTILLGWGLHKPIERKGTLIITAFPVVFLYLIYDIFQYINDISITDPSSKIVVMIIRCGLIILMMVAYIFANQVKERKK
ncbi:hypothetical protein DSAG12_00407 [Promethearchaeum syntrophicum]|uniref:Uncharacterized protein n=1 Tax=Promethearchaeum syntrophicum TaxID=2594042 RepID=A0A5B9D672_9ARCH|nr:hypothetical protein [Candidatus Prometheoarchaeum syntrophicum]QEE14594.1 hypothetical protein DSAG12_00407 [Candidatus Prometheoarchaeum syntrophicum]